MMTRARLMLASLGLVAGVSSPFFAGCGGGGDEPTPEPEGTEAGDPDTSRPSFDAGPERVLGPTVECTIGAAIEQEPNDTKETANAFTELGYCGVLDSGADVDYVTFVTPTGTKLGVFQAVIDGKVDFELSLNGGATFGPGETTKFGSGTYVVKTFTKAGKPASYRMRIQFDKT
jgi:hypothetical protein